MEKIMKLLNEIKHPEINNSLVELGMIGKVEKKDSVVVELKLPMLGIPIKEMLIDSIKDKLNDKNVKVKISLMNDNEKNKFFELSKQNWAI